MLALDGRVRDLEDVEDAQRDVVRQVGKDAGHADEPGLAVALEVNKVSITSFAAIVASLGDMWTCTRSSRSVPSLVRDRSRRRRGRWPGCSRADSGGAGGNSSGQPHLEARKNSSRLVF